MSDAERAELTRSQVTSCASSPMAATAGFGGGGCARAIASKTFGEVCESIVGTKTGDSEEGGEDGDDARALKSPA